jgi:hypothetical protein
MAKIGYVAPSILLPFLGCEFTMRETRDQILDCASVALRRRDWLQIGACVQVVKITGPG